MSFCFSLFFGLGLKGSFYFCGLLFCFMCCVIAFVFLLRMHTLYSILSYWYHAILINLINKSVLRWQIFNLISQLCFSYYPFYISQTADLSYLFFLGRAVIIWLTLQHHHHIKADFANLSVMVAIYTCAGRRSPAVESSESEPQHKVTGCNTQQWAERH